MTRKEMLPVVEDVTENKREIRDLAHLIIASEEEDTAFDQPCIYGHRCGQSSTCQRFDSCPDANKNKVHYTKSPRGSLGCTEFKRHKVKKDGKKDV